MPESKCVFNFKLNGSLMSWKINSITPPLNKLGLKNIFLPNLNLLKHTTDID